MSAYTYAAKMNALATKLQGRRPATVPVTSEMEDDMIRFARQHGNPWLTPALDRQINRFANPLYRLARAFLASFRAPIEPPAVFDCKKFRIANRLDVATGEP